MRDGTQSLVLGLGILVLEARMGIGVLDVILQLEIGNSALYPLDGTGREESDRCIVY